MREKPRRLLIKGRRRPTFQTIDNQRSALTTQIVKGPKITEGDRLRSMHMRNKRTFPPPHPLGRAPISPVNGIVGIPFVSLRGRNCRFRSHLGCSGLGSAFSLECLDAPVVLLTIYLVQDGSTGFLYIKASRTVERKEISLFKNGKPFYRRKRRNTVDHLV